LNTLKHEFLIMLLKAYAQCVIIREMNTWSVRLADAFQPEFDELEEPIQDGLLSVMGLLKQTGPELGRPQVDTLNGSKYPNMKELRFKVNNQAWRFAFAFDPDRQAIVLVGGSKSGVSEKRFYKQLIDKADSRYTEHLRGIGQ
jgi:hypothetical protein